MRRGRGRRLGRAEAPVATAAPRSSRVRCAARAGHFSKLIITLRLPGTHRAPSTPAGRALQPDATNPEF